MLIKKHVHVMEFLWFSFSVLVLTSLLFWMSLLNIKDKVPKSSHLTRVLMDNNVFLKTFLECL